MVAKGHVIWIASEGIIGVWQECSMFAVYGDTLINKKSLISVQCRVFIKQKKKDGQMASVEEFSSNGWK